MRLALVIGSLRGGGAERVMATLANAWASRGVHVALITIAPSDGDAYELDPRIARIGLDLAADSPHAFAGLFNNLRRVFRLRKALRAQQPDAVLSFITTQNILSVLAARPLRIPVVISERIAPDIVKTPFAWKLLRRHAYRRATAAVAQTDYAAAWFRKCAPVVPVSTIPNPLSIANDADLDANAQAALDACGQNHIFLAAGRLDAQKGYDLLLPAFATIAARHPTWRLLIAGEGPARASIETQIKTLGLADRVILAGFTRTPHALMRKAHAYVLSSRYEGFPNALLEAMACGLPCVSFDCATGPSALIRSEENGILVPPEDVIGLGTAMERVMNDAPMRKRLGLAAKASVEKYSVNTTIDRWNEVLGQVAGEVALDPPALRVIYIMGAGRSGSTILDKVLAEHPSTFGAGELTNLVNATSTRLHLCSCGTHSSQCPFWSEAHRKWAGRIGEANIQNYPVLQRRYERKLNYRRLTIGTHGDPLADDYRERTHALLEAIRDTARVPIIVDSSKNPARAFALSQIRGIDLRVIHLVRDVRGVACSLAKSYDADPTNGIMQPLARKALWRTAGYWLITNMMANRVRHKLGARAMLLRYEDFAADPTASLKDIAEFSGLDYAPVIARMQANEAFSAGHMIEGNRARMQRNVHIVPDERWRQRLSKIQQWWLLLLSAPLSLRYGYASRTPSTVDAQKDFVRKTEHDAGAKPPRLMLMLRSLNRGGTERQAVTLAVQFQSQGWPVSVATFYPDGELAQPLLDAGIPVFNLGKRGRWDVLGFFSRARKLLRQEQPDIVYSLLPTANLFALAIRIGIPSLNVAWGIRASNMQLARHGWLPRLEYWLERRLAGFPARIIANSEEGARLRITQGFPSRTMRVVPNGIDTERFQFDSAGRRRLRAEWGVADHEVLVGLAARLVPIKDHPSFLRAAAALAQQDPCWRFVCIGAGTDRYASTLQELCEQLGLRQRVIWAGPHDDMAAAYSALDVACSSSTGEGFSNAIAEAMACERPCVVTDVGDSARIVADLGIVVPPGDFHALAEGIRQVWEHAAIEGQALGTALRQRITEKYDARSLATRTGRILESLHQVRNEPAQAGT